MYFISSWICTKTSKNMFVKIVYQGGRVEIHDRPILAAELLSRNPRCCVAHPDVFHQPYAVVSPSTTLTLGQKYLIVPVHTITKLQLIKYSSSQRQLPDLRADEQKQKLDKPSSCSWLMKSDKKEKREADCRRERGLQNGGIRLSLGHVHQWQPGLESIKE